MKAILSTTYDDKYLFFLPIVTWCWNQLGVDVVCFIRDTIEENELKNRSRYSLAVNPTGDWSKIKINTLHSMFTCPPHKSATYAQCSRLYAAALDLPEKELLVTSDIDMAVFKRPPYHDMLTVYGYDLTPPGQIPICYITGTVKEWRAAMRINGRTYQQCLDDLLGGIEAEHFRGNYWSKDQQEAYENIIHYPATMVSQVTRAREGTQFAMNRIDRDDAYMLEHLDPNNFDFHMNRPGYDEQNFEKIIKVLQYHYPDSDLTWMREYRNQYIQLL